MLAEMEHVLSAHPIYDRVITARKNKEPLMSSDISEPFISQLKLQEFNLYSTEIYSVKLKWLYFHL